MVPCDTSRMKRGDILIIDDPGGPKTAEERRRALLWFKDVMTGFVERRPLPAPGLPKEDDQCRTQ